MKLDAAGKGADESRQRGGNLESASQIARICWPDSRSLAGYLSQLRSDSEENLLRRTPIQLDMRWASEFIRGKVVLVTGAAGSIGSELCRRILYLNPSRLVSLDCAEKPLDSLMAELRQDASGHIILPELVDVTDRSGMERVFALHRPVVVFHAAALKDVPLLESYPREALRVNWGGTKVVAETARKFGGEKCVLISTDKAVNPSSVMGASKRFAEMLLGQMDDPLVRPRFVSVRFGNVLGSSGSVLPIFREQLARGGPLTVTHPDMRRYFMTALEAVQLVLQAAVFGRGGDTFILDMGKPVRVVELAEDLIRLSGLIPGEDVRIDFIGVRPGEKLSEEIRLDNEVVQPTNHPQVFQLSSGKRASPDPALFGAIENLILEGSPANAIVTMIHELLQKHDRQVTSPDTRSGP